MSLKELYRLNDNEDEDHWDNFGEDYDEEEEEEDKKYGELEDDEDIEDNWD